MRRPLAWLFLVTLAAAMPPASADDPFSSGPPPADSKDESTPDYFKALDMQRKGHWKEAQKAFQDLMKKYPNSVHAEDCELRGGENCYLGCEKLHEGGPSARRIDVSVMGDGFQIDPKQQKEGETWAHLAVDVLWNAEYAYSEYKDYFKFYYVRLASKDEGVDEVLSDEQLKKLEEKNRKKHEKRKPKEFNTALDCKAAGPQRQVMSDHELVYTWLAYANKDVPGCGDDGLVIAFAKFGELGMAELDNGLANCGRPDRSVTVHEFGHAFVGLLDEYANQPGPPTYKVRAANATSDLTDIPWQHFIDAKFKGVGTVLGGATYKAGVWRPYPSCAMNSAGASNGYCPVCREAAVLRIYSYINPIDKTSHLPLSETKCTLGDDSQIVVTPMQPKTHDLKCEWFVDRLFDSDTAPERPSDGTTTDGLKASANGSGGSGGRARDPSRKDYDYPPLGNVSELGKVEKLKGEGTKFIFPTGKLGRGHFQVTCRVWDPCEGVVLKDPYHLLEERETFFIRVGAKK